MRKITSSSGLSPSTIVDVLDDAVSDHCPVLATIGLAAANTMKAETITRRNFWRPVYYSVRSDMASLGLNCLRVPPDMDVDKSLDELLSVIRPIVDHYFPEETFKVRPGKPDLYLARDTRNLMEVRCIHVLHVV